MKFSIKSLLSAMSAMLLAVSAYAQVTTSSLGGQVVDESGAPLAGAVVIAVHTPTGSQYYSVANEAGQYNINGMRAGGPYKIDFSFLGMSTVRYEDIALKLGERFTLDATMKSTNELNAVTVVAEKPFNASITGAGQSFSREQIEGMPSVDKSIYDIVKYTPQANLNKDGGISFSGTNNRYNSFQIDGAVANDSFGLSDTGMNGGQAGSNPVSLDAIEEVQVVVAPFDVRQSGFTGGAINAITKSGTNEVKGTAYARFFNQDFVGTTPGPLEGDLALAKERTKYTQQLTQTYGFTVGAPIVKNKLFLFLSGEYKKSSTPNIYSPDNGSYAGYPFTDDVMYGTQNLGKEFNSTMAEAMLDKYIKTYGPIDGYSESYGQHQVSDRSINAMARVDWNINDDNKLMIRYQFADAYADKYSAGKTSYIFNNSSYKQSNRTHTAVIELNSRVNDTMSNELRATGVIVRDFRQPGYPGATIYIMDKMYISLGNEYSSGANSVSTDTYTLTDNFNITAGKHNITIGTHNEFFKFNNVFLQYAYGGYTFSTVQDFFNDEPVQYDYKYADPKYSGGQPIWAATTYALELGFYAQDEWKPSRNFTLSYGLRVDIPMLLNKPTENSEFNATSIAKLNNEYVGVTPKAQALFSPRVGFRWYLDEAHRSLLRGGLGLFTGRVPFVWFSNAYNNTGMETKSVTIKDASKLAELMQTPTSKPYDTYIATGKISGSGAGATINTLNENFKYPQVFRVNLGFDQDFGEGWKFTFDGIYSKTLNNVYFKNLAINDKGFKTYAVSANSANANNVMPCYSAISSDYSTIVALANTNKGYTYSLSGQLQKHFEFGLDLSAAYTFGHSYSVSDGTSSVAYSNWKKNNSYDTNAEELSYSLFDRPHKITAVVSYTTPMYLSRLRTHFTLTYQGGSGQRYSYIYKESKTDFNGDGYKGNSLMYIPTADEVGAMNWTNAADAATFEAAIQSDSYLSSHRGQWSTRYAGISPFEHHFDFQILHDIYYDAKKTRKVQFTFDLINASNLFNRNWGLYYTSTTSRTMLQVDKLTKGADGNYTPTYSYYSKNVIGLSDFYSRWRFQLGLRLTF